MNTILLALVSIFSFAQTITEKIWIEGKTYEIPYDGTTLTLNGDFSIRCSLLDNNTLTDDGSDIFIDKNGNYFHLAMTDYGIAIVPLESSWVKQQ